MFVKSYSYKIRKKNFRKWKEINNQARKIYRMYGSSGKSVRLLKKEIQSIKIVELDYYKSKSEFLRIIKKVDRDKNINKLFNEFLKIVDKKKIVEEEFETL